MSAGVSMLTTVTAVPRRAGLTRRQLEEEYLSAPGCPVVLTDAMDDWPARRKWTFDFLAEQYGDRPVVAMAQHQLGGRQARAYPMPLRTFVQYSRQPERFQAGPGTTAPLYVAFEIFDRHSAMRDDFNWPAAVDNVYSTLGPEVYDWFLRYNAVLLLGPAGTVTPFHEDLFGTHAWLAQFAGRKRVVFHPPNLDLAKRSATAMRRDHYEPGAFDGEPAFVDDLQPGELMVFPRGWRHEVTALEPSISLAMNFVNATNLMAHVLEICRDLPSWAARLSDPVIRAALSIAWTADDVAGALRR